MGRRLVLCALIAAPACYHPTIEAPCTASCETAGEEGACPGNQECGEDLQCHAAGTDECSNQLGADAGEVCVGHRFLTVCFIPGGDVVLANETINTNQDTRCKVMPANGGNPEVCAIVGRDVTVTGVVSVTGTRAFAIAASDSLEVFGTLDGASHIAGNAGPAANTPIPTCSKPVAPISGLAGSGGFGGSFQAIGGGGGKGAGTGGEMGGVPSENIVPDLITGLSGPCASGNGSDGDNVNGGFGGAGGGAIALLAGQLSIEGVVNVSGAAGSGGRLDVGGGGGGGAGGMVLLDADSISVPGIVLANGGGGGGGAGAGGGAEGGAGFEPTTTPPFDGALGGLGGGSAGHGGAGGGNIVLKGSLGLMSVSDAGGGGGGSVGYILMTTVVTGMMSPAPTQF
jgi:hypothetical protein